MGRKHRARSADVAREATPSAPQVDQAGSARVWGLTSYLDASSPYIDEAAVIGTSDVWACIRLVAGTIAGRDWSEWRGPVRLPGVSRIVRRPAAAMTRRAWVARVVTTLMLYHRAYLWMVGGVDAEGVPGSLLPIPPNAIVPEGQLIPKEEESYNHTARPCRIGPDNKLYVQLGQPYNVPPKEKMDLYNRAGIGGIVRMDRDGKNREVYARGLRNAVGMDFNPKDRTLWSNDNQVDGMGDDQPPGELNRIEKAGLDFGFPWYGGGRVRTNEYKNDTPPAGVVFPEVEQAAHAADLGLMFYTGTMFPEKYRGAIFSTQHGSWNRTVPVGARLMVTFLKPDGHVAGKSEPFAEGWNDNGYYLGRPVDVAQLHDGSLLVSDDLVGALYRIWYDGR